MPSPRPLPQELIDKVIDELGEAYRDAGRKKYSSNTTNVAREALRACTLVSKNWTDRSRMHLFKEIKIGADDSGLSLIPPESLVPYVTKLEIHLRRRPYLLFSSKILTPFYTAPITDLVITAGELTPARVYFVECIIALSATLRTVKFTSCTLPLDLILDIALKHPGLKQLHLRCCDVEPTNPDHRTTPPLDTHSTDLGLVIFSPVHQDPTVTAVAQLPIQFSRLEFDYIQGPRMTRSSNTLIRANAESLSSLTVHIVTWAPWKGESEPLFSLGGCFNLSELTLDTEDTEGPSLSLVTTFTDILSTLDPKRDTRLEWVKLVITCIHRFLCKGSWNQLAQAWSHLDIILAKLAKVAGRRLTFVLTSMHKGKCVSFGRKRLPEFLPRFCELGEFRVEYERTLLEADTYHDCFCDHEPICLEEGYGDISQN